MGTPFFENCKLSLSWATGIPEIQGTFQVEEEDRWLPKLTQLSLLQIPTILNNNDIQLEPNSRMQVHILIDPKNMLLNTLTARILKNKPIPLKCSQPVPHTKGSQWVEGNIWGREAPETGKQEYHKFVDNRITYISTILTNESNTRLTLDKNTLQIATTSTPPTQSISLFTTFLVDDEMPQNYEINSKNYLDYSVIETSTLHPRNKDKD